MKIVIKGGVWKNTEDEILKAAVMKYGLNQWARISSLLVRKSAKQCKARWYEWLDPAIKKTEWTREEDEKLLHLAKLMPTQWRTIAPIVGRTPTQCLERYERLLDMASGREDALDAKDDPRRLRPGEIDPHPETKPARPDPVDMDEDEKEMLSEARARLANTKGKKAKRKAREKQLEEARRLASLQKKRELKAAGIDIREKAKKGRGIDYATEVPFERRPAPGFYDVAEENEITKAMQDEFRPVTKDELEGKKRRDVEKDLAKQDIAKRKIAERENAPNVLRQQLEEAEASNLRRRGKMMLPSPQVTDAELEVLAKEGSSLEASLALEGGNKATNTLVGGYATPFDFATPMRTPAGLHGAGTSTASGANRVIQEAQALARLQQGQTPLLGGENPDISGSDFTGITPQRIVDATPNPIAAAAAKIGATPSRFGMHGATPSALQPTPQRRDALGLNSESNHVESFTKIKNALSILPAPKGGYQLAPPEVAGVDEDDTLVPMEEDATDRENRLAAEKAKALENDIKLRSTAIQRNLPRPYTLDGLPVPKSHQEICSIAYPDDAARELVLAELVKMFRSDAARFPPDTPISDSISCEQQEFTFEQLREASDLVKKEISPSEMQNMGESISTTWDRLRKEIMFSPAFKKFVKKTEMSDDDQIASMQQEFDAIKKEIAVYANRATKIEQKVSVMLAGLQKRSAALTKEINSTIEKVKIAKIDRDCYRHLLHQERAAIPSRLAYYQNLISAQEERERSLQEQYKSLTSIHRTNS